VLPHQPYCEQQLPKVEPAHVSPVVPPHAPSLLTANEPPPQVPNAAWQPVPQ